MATNKKQAEEKQQEMQEVKAEAQEEATPFALSEEMMAALKTQMMAEIRQEVKAEVEAEVLKSKEEGQPKRESEEELARANEPVKLKLFKDKDHYKHDVLVIVNGKSWLIKRGVEVEVPRKVANALSLADDQTAAAADIIAGYEETYEAGKDKLA